MLLFIISCQLGSTQISSHQFNSAPINSGRFRSAQINLMSIRIISSLSVSHQLPSTYLLALSASHPLPSTLSRFSHFPSTSKHMLSSLFPLSSHFQQEQRGGLRVAFWDPPPSACNGAERVSSSPILTPIQTLEAPPLPPDFAYLLSPIA